MTDRLRLGITGAAGRMGAALIAAVHETGDILVTAATERADSPRLGQDMGLITGSSRSGVLLTADLASVLGDVDVVIDFTAPDATLRHAALCAERGKSIVIGTTGLSATARDTIAGLAQQVPVVLAPNMSVGVNLLFKLVLEAARTLGDDYDVEIVETHHRLKKDAPSGTALRLAEVAAEALGLDRERDLVRTRDGQVGERPRRTIGVQALRGGDVVGDHTVFFLGQGERLELTHKATSRGNFAQGALRAARWVVRQPPGVYDMQDVLGLRAASGSRS